MIDLKNRNAKNRLKYAHTHLKIRLRCEWNGVRHKVTLGFVLEVGQTASSECFPYLKSMVSQCFIQNNSVMYYNTLDVQYAYKE